ncbi:serine/threonine-protein kinase [Streptomyces sp. NPDC058420]|uniref:serine/threonine-protein kinase n=1 Tax=Streptomyces sp. NPDC058420 TaxID=3346489 RepID=UPI003656A06D
MTRKIGQGGEGEIFAAWDEELQQDVAVKLQPARAFVSTNTYAQDGEPIEQEYVRLKAMLDISGIPRVLDSGSFGRNRRQFLIMERVHGETIASWIGAHHPVPQDAAVSVIGQLCEILDELHGKGYVHRDVTPNNTMLEADGRVRLLDVGISVGSGERNDGPGGTDGYAAPEQHDRNAVLTAQADVFSLGAMMFKMVISELPYAGLEHPLDAAALPFPGRLQAKMPEQLRALGFAMIAVAPDERPNGVAEVLRRLRPMLPEPGSRASPKATRPDPTARYRLGSPIP